MIIREFAHTDLVEYASLVNTSKSDRPNHRMLSPEQIQSIYNKHPCYDSGGHLIALTSNRMVGEAIILRDPVEDSDKCSDTAVLHLSVIPEERGKGIGQKLLDRILVYSKSDNIHKIETAVPVSCSGLVKFYERNRFERFGKLYDLQKDISKKLPDVVLSDEYNIRSANMEKEKHQFFEVWNLAFRNQDDVNLTFVSDEIDSFLEFPGIKSCYFAAERVGDGALVGAISAYYDTNSDKPSKEAIIEVVAVLESERKKGIGKGLVRQALDWMVSEQKESALVSIHQNTELSLGLFKSLGFQIAKEEYTYSYRVC
jgi:ribosomal protein S18 acetylase RimI-like enzyme